MLIEFDFRGGPFYKKYPNFDSWFSPLLGPGGTLGPSGVLDQKVALNKKRPAPDLRGSHFKKMLKFQNFCWLAGQPSLPAPFSRAVGWKSKLRSQLFVCLVVPILKRCDTTPCPKTPGGDRFGRNPLFGVRAWPQGPRGPSHPPNYYLLIKWALKISRRSVQRVKSYGMFSKWQTDTQKRITSVPLLNFFLHICEGEEGKPLQTQRNFYLFTLWKII